MRDALRLNFSVCILRKYIHDRYGKREIAVNTLEKSVVSADIEGSTEKSNVNTEGLIGHMNAEDEDVIHEKKVELIEMRTNEPTTIQIGTRRRTSFHVGALSRQRSMTERDDRLKRAQSEDTTHRGGRFWTAKRSGYIDVWWLDDTGGLTVLLPHVLRKKKQWGEVPIRLFALHSGTQSAEKQRKEVETLLLRVRIPVHSVTIVAKPEPSELVKGQAETGVEFCKANISLHECEFLLKKFSMQKDQKDKDESKGEESGADQPEADLKKMVEDNGIYRTAVRRLADQHALGNLIKSTASDDTLLVIATLPFPRVAVSSYCPSDFLWIFAIVSFIALH